MGWPRRQAGKAADSQAAAAEQQQATVDAAAAQAAQQVQAQQAPPPPAAAPAEDDPIAKIKQLGELNAQGLLSDEEFAAAKSKLLGI